MRGMLLGFAVAAALALSAPAAHGATLQGSTGSEGTMIWLDAAPGETNQITLSDGVDSVVVQDAGAPLTALGTCQQLGPNAASCPNGTIVASLGAGHDSLASLETSGGSHARRSDTLTVDGGAGNDRLTGRPGQRSSILHGGPGADVLAENRSRASELHGGPGDDVLLAGGDPLRSWNTSYWCDGGTDVVIADRGDHPQDPWACEQAFLLPVPLI